MRFMSSKSPCIQILTKIQEMTMKLLAKQDREHHRERPSLVQGQEVQKQLQKQVQEREQQLASHDLLAKLDPNLVPPRVLLANQRKGEVQKGVRKLVVMQGR